MGSKRGVPMRSLLSKRNLLLKGIPAEYIDCDIESYVNDEEKKELYQKYIDNMDTMYEDRVCLANYGANGTGKTYLSCILIKEAYRRRYKSHITTLAHLIDLMFTPDKTEEIRAELKCIRDAEFLVIDEVGKENFNKSLSNIALLEETLRRAVVNGQVVILCTNLSLQDIGDVKGLYSQYGKSIKSLVEGDFVKIKFDAKDFRTVVKNKKKGIKLLKGEEYEDE